MVTKEDIIKTFEEQINLIQTKLDELKVQASLGKSELKQTIEPEINKLESQLSEAGKRFKELSGISEDALGDLKEGLGKALESISEAIKNAAGRYK